MGPDDLERVCALCFKKQAPCQPVGLKNQASIMSSSIDRGSRRLTLVQQSKVCKTLPIGTDIVEALKESFRHLRKKKEKSISSIGDRYGEKQAICEGSDDMSRSSA